MSLRENGSQSTPTSDLHFIPGFFGNGSENFLNALFQNPVLRFRSLKVQVGPEVDAEIDSGEARAWLLATEPGHSRVLSGTLVTNAGVRAPCRIEVFARQGSAPAVGVSTALDVSEVFTRKDLEIALISIVCRALSSESQGAAIFGLGLGNVAAGISRGTVAEQLRQAMDLHAESTLALLLAEDTRSALGDVPGFSEDRVSSVIVMRPIAA